MTVEWHLKLSPSLSKKQTSFINSLQKKISNADFLKFVPEAISEGLSSDMLHNVSLDTDKLLNGDINYLKKKIIHQILDVVIWKFARTINAPMVELLPANVFDLKITNFGTSLEFEVDVDTFFNMQY